MPVKDKIMVSFAIEQDAMKKIIEIQLQEKMFNRSDLIRKLVDIGLENFKEGQAS